ncbi:MAG: hypothetical protein KDD67_08345, partial [Ignavibacteriae bacterium]|nr:hypothetical protein [Ignavibacteriota bacterium]
MSRPPAQGRKIQIAYHGRGVQPSAFPSAMYHCDRKSGVEGKWVVLGGLRITKKKNLDISRYRSP